VSFAGHLTTIHARKPADEAEGRKMRKTRRRSYETDPLQRDELGEENRRKNGWAAEC